MFLRELFSNGTKDRFHYLVPIMQHVRCHQRSDDVSHRRTRAPHSQNKAATEICQDQSVLCCDWFATWIYRNTH